MAITQNTLAAPRTTSTAGPGRWLLPVILLGNVLNVVDLFVVNVALPTLSRTLHAGPAALELVVTGYSVSYACFLVVGGRLGDTFGRRRLFLLGMAGFTLASAACGLAPTVQVLIAARLVQGATAGLSWRPAFLINIPVGIVGLIAARKVIPESRAAEPAPVDGRGTSMLAAAVILLLVPLTLGREEHWPVWCWVMLAAAPVAAAVFAVSQRRAERRGGLPLLPPSLLRSAGMRRGLPAGVVLFAAWGGMMLTTTVALQYGLRFSPVKAGLTLTPYATAFLAGSLLARPLTARLGRMVPVGGALLLASGFAGYALQAYNDFDGFSPFTLIPAEVAIGFGQALIVLPLVMMVLAGVPADRTGVASGIWTTNQQISVALGATGIGTLFFTVAADHGYAMAATAAGAIEALLSLIGAAIALILPRT